MNRVEWIIGFIVQIYDIVMVNVNYRYVYGFFYFQVYGILKFVFDSCLCFFGFIYIIFIIFKV